MTRWTATKYLGELVSSCVLREERVGRKKLIVSSEPMEILEKDVDIMSSVSDDYDKTYFVQCNKYTDNHLKNKSSYEHPVKGEGSSLFITKFPYEELSMKEFIDRLTRYRGSKKQYCVPDYADFKINFPREVLASLPGLNREYSSGSLFNVWEKIRQDSGLKVEYTTTNSSSGTIKNLIKIMKGHENFSNHLENITIFAEMKKDKNGNPKDGVIDKYLKSGDIDIKNGRYAVSDFMKNIKKNLNVIVEGVAGSGKSYMLQELRESGVYGEQGSRIEVVVFHPSTSYEEFVSGVRPNFTKQEGEGDFVTYEGVFVQMCNRAAQNPEQPYLLFIDEINRANTSRVFGDLMLVLEKTKRQSFEGLSTEGRDGALFEASVETMWGEYVRLQTPIIKSGKEYNKLAVPSNLHVLGTMNTTDRSVGTIDLALRRRFHWITQEPMDSKDALLKALKLQEGENEEVENVIQWFIEANKHLKHEVGPDARLGHAYFFVKDDKAEPKAEPVAEPVAEALITQLLEIIFTFNIKENLLERIGLPKVGKYGDMQLGYIGTGLGRRPILKNKDSKKGGKNDSQDTSGTTGEAKTSEAE